MAVSEDVMRHAQDNVTALEEWAEQGFPEGMEEIQLRGMPCSLTPLRMLDVSKEKRGRMESRGLLIELGWIGKSGARSKQVVVRFNPRSRPTCSDPTCVFYVFRDSGTEELLSWERIPLDDLAGEDSAVTLLHKILRRHTRKDDFCRMLFAAYQQDVALTEG